MGELVANPKAVSEAINELNGNMTDLFNKVFASSDRSGDMNTFQYVFQIINAWGSVTNIPNIPGGYHTVIQIWDSSANIGDLTKPRNQMVIATTGKTYFRRFNNGAWTAWST